MLMIAKFYEQEFKDSETNKAKVAYMSACKWFASNILSNKDLKNIKAEYVIDKENSKVTLMLFCELDSEEERKRHCQVCKQLHSQVFLNEFFNCNCCNVKALNLRQKDRLRIKQNYYKAIVNGKHKIK